MKTYLIVIALSFATSILAASAIAEEACCDKKVEYFSPPPGAYKQLSPEEARKAKNLTFSNGKEASVTLERIGDEKRNEKTD